MEKMKILNASEEVILNGTLRIDERLFLILNADTDEKEKQDEEAIKKLRDIRNEDITEHDIKKENFDRLLEMPDEEKLPKLARMISRKKFSQER